MKRALYFVLCAAMVSAVTVRIPERDRILSSLPLWRGPADFKNGNYVYRTDTPSQLMVAYPERLLNRQSSRPDNLVTQRLPLEDQVVPIADSNAIRTEGGSFRYRYAIRNGAEAADPIARWSFISPAEDTDTRLTHPRWSGRRTNGFTGQAYHLIPDQRPGAAAGWNGTEEPIYPGERLPGFEAVSRFLPGLLTASFKSMRSDAFAFPNEPPVEVLNGLASIQRAEVNTQLRLIIGPRYSPDLTVEEWRRAFAQDLRRASRVVNEWSGSVYLKEVIDLLEASAALPTVLSNQAAPTDPLEQEIWEVIQLMTRVP